MWTSWCRPAVNRWPCWNALCWVARTRAMPTPPCGCWMTAVATRWSNWPPDWGAATAIAPDGSTPKPATSTTGCVAAAGNWLPCSMQTSSRNGDFSNAASGFCWIPPSPLSRPPRASLMQIRCCATCAWNAGCCPMRSASTAGSNRCGTGGGPWSVPAQHLWRAARP